jgi:hypothetical protein
MASSNIMPSVTPISRDKLRSLKAENDEKIHIYEIQKIVGEISKNVIKRASKTNKTYLIQPIVETYRNYKFLKDNMIDILSGLQSKFPDSSIELKTITWWISSKNHQYYDTTKISKTGRKYLFTGTSECILISW